MSNQRFSITPAKAATDNNLTDSVYRTLSVIGIFGNREGWCWPGQSTIAEMRGVSRQTINSHIKILTKLGYLNIHPRYDEETGAQKSNMMQIKFDFEPDLTGGVKSKVLQGVSNLGLDTPHQAQDLTHNDPYKDLNNEKEDGDSFRAVISAYENEIGLLTKGIGQDIEAALEDYGSDWIVEAISVAARANKRSWSYVNGILRRWKVEGKQTFASNGTAHSTVKQANDAAGGVYV